ncbi:MAG: tetratricopeptide repeat protein, partial [Myxococcota bacterium]|nr:tetratricopeptide repeat protein [Myxococcota bacterium]
AVLDFDGYGVAHDEAILVSQGFRDAFLESGVFFPIEAYDITERYTEGYEDDIAQARELMGSGRRSLDAGNLSRAIQHFSTARDLHERAGSHLALRPEAADVDYFLGLAYSRQGRTTQAQESLERTLRLYPGYDSSRATQQSQQVTGLFESANSTILSGTRRLIDPDDAELIAKRLRVSAVLSGYIDEQGEVYARLTQGSRVVNELSWRVQEVAPFPGDPVYQRFVSDITAGSSVTPGMRSMGTGVQQGFSDSSSDEGFDALPEFESQPVAPAPRRSVLITEPEEPTFRERVQALFRTRKTTRGNTTADIRQERGPVRYGDKPITQTWWFWTATGAVTVGTATTVAVVVRRNGSQDSSKNTGVYTVTVEPLAVETSN